MPSNVPSPRAETPSKRGPSGAPFVLTKTLTVLLKLCLSTSLTSPKPRPCSHQTIPNKYIWAKAGCLWCKWHFKARVLHSEHWHVACEYLAGVLGEVLLQRRHLTWDLKALATWSKQRKASQTKTKTQTNTNKTLQKKKKKNPHSSRKDGDKMASACRITYVILLTLLEEGEGALLRAAKHHALFIW